jgi:hypothetical protein
MASEFPEKRSKKKLIIKFKESASKMHASAKHFTRNLSLIKRRNIRDNNKKIVNWFCEFNANKNANVEGSKFQKSFLLFF